MKPDHQEHWIRLRDRFLKDIQLLLQWERDESAMLLMCSFIDAAASLYGGRASEHRSGQGFRAFVTQYLSDFTRITFGDLLFVFADGHDRHVNDLVDMLYLCYRNGLVHEGTLPPGIHLVRPKEDWLCSVNANGIMELNTPEMFIILQAGTAKYESDLETHANLQDNFAARINYIWRQRFKKETAF
jgi:hypothetical protein